LTAISQLNSSPLLYNYEKKEDKNVARESVPAPSNRRKSNALFLLAGQEMSVVGMHSDARGKGGWGGIKETFPEHCKPVHKCTKQIAKPSE